jgi:hypothetical protein
LNNRIVSRDNDDLANLKIKDLASADYIFDSTVVKAIALTFPDKYDFQISLRANYLHQLRRTLTEKQYDSIANTPIFSERLNEIPKYIYRNVLNLETTKTAKSTKQIDSLAFIRPPTKPVFTDDGTNWDNFLTTNLKADIAVKNGARKGVYIVSVSFVVSKDGKVEYVRALNDPGFGTKEEAVRLISSSPNWKPATLFGKEVPFTKTQEIIFNVE